jgi:hypothetical protein
MRRKKPLLLLTFAAFAVVSNAQTLISRTMTSDPSAPLKLTSIEGTLSETLSSVTVKNVSAKPIVGFQLGWTVAVPAGCSSTATEPELQSARPDRASLAPGQSGTFKDYGVAVSSLVQKAKEARAGIITVQVGILKVDFADGTSWDLPHSSNVLSPSQLSFEAKNVRRGTFCLQQ